MTIPLIKVETAHSRYVIDQNAGTYTRTRVHDDANNLAYWGVEDGVPVEYRDIVSTLEPGGQVVIVHHDGSWVRSTAIQSVTHEPALSVA